MSKYTSGRTLICSFSTDYLIKNPPHRCKGILAVRGEDVQVTLHHKMDISNWWLISLLESDWQTDKQRYAYCLFAWVVEIIMIMQNMQAGDDPRGGGHVRHVQDPALGRQTKSKHLGRDREARVFGNIALSRLTTFIAGTSTKSSCKKTSRRRSPIRPVEQFDSETEE